MRVFALLLTLLLFQAAASGEYIDYSQSYSLLYKIKTKQPKYKVLCKDAVLQKVFTVAQINKAIAENNSSLSTLIRVIALDESGREEQTLAELAKLKHDAEYEKMLEVPSIRMALADIMLRSGQYKEVVALLPKKTVLGYSRHYRQQGQYYLGMAGYLGNGEMNKDFMIAKNYFALPKKIYYEKHDRLQHGY